MMVKCNDDEKPLTREEALDIAMSKVIYYDAHGGLEVSIPFDEGVEWQRSQSCHSCKEKDKRIAELERKNEIIFSVLYNIANACECQNCDTVCEKDYIQICSEHKARIALSEAGEVTK